VLLIKRIALLGILLLAISTANGWALQRIEKDGLQLYYPEKENQIAARLLENYQKIVAFLSSKDLTIHYPLHVILDEDLDLPKVRVNMFPHREIRIPLRAPGVMEDGYTESDPWTYFLFKGLCLQAIFSIREGIPAKVHTMFGEIISPNIVLPEWILDGVSALLYKLYRNNPLLDPISAEIFHTSAPPDLDLISNHPELWPGHDAYKIYGRPFIFWIYQKYGWNRLLDFIQRHGRGIIPVEIDLKARQSFGATWSALWQKFQMAHNGEKHTGKGLHITGYWPDPFVYWNRSGIYPGIVKLKRRGRYGFMDAYKVLWLSEYDDKGVSRIVEYQGDTSWPYDIDHVWDPGQGGVAITRKGHHPYLMLLPKGKMSFATRLWGPRLDAVALIPGPPDVIQMSGPVMDSRGRVTVSANLNGNWDIWLYDKSWHRITTAPSLEIDPWIQNDRLVFASNKSGRFQVVNTRMQPMAQCNTAALLPRLDKYLCLSAKGWQMAPLNLNNESRMALTAGKKEAVASKKNASSLNAKPYTPLKSILPNYLVPEAFYDGSDFQAGVVTEGRDVTGKYTIDAGLRYATGTNFFSGILGGRIKDVGARVTRYPLSYTTRLKQVVDESRNEFSVFWTPLGINEIELSMNGRYYEPLERSGPSRDEYWSSFSLHKTFGRHQAWLNLDVFKEGSQSLFGGGVLWFGEKIYTSLYLEAGKTWGDLMPGHNTYRIGGNVAEGYFTQRPTRLFPLRGFDSNIIEAGQAVTTGAEVLWPLVNLQAGYKTLPLYFHRIYLGTFIDTGMASDHPSSDDILVGAGFELVTSLEIAWGNLSSFRIGLAWPLRQPGGLNESGPVFLIQLGHPL
jgi:hypothetical protein